jgi:DNA polymerase III subunit beta
MKFSILQQDLLPLLHAVSRSIGIRPTLPVLSNILLSAENGKLKIASTNLEIGVIKLINAKIEEEGEITVPAKTITEVINGLAATEVIIESVGEVLNITSGKFKATINGISSSEFPVIPLPEGKGLIFDKESISSSSQILFASAVDEGRPVLTGILTQASVGKLNLVATDGFRLAHREVSIKDATIDFKSLIPKKTFEEIVRIIGEEESDQVEVAHSPSQNQIIFKIGQTILSSRLIEGNFPSWEKIIPQNIVTRAILEREDLLKAVKLASVFAKNEANIITISVSSFGINLSSKAKELGEQENEVEAQIEGDNLKIAFNARFLQEAVSAVPSIQLIMEFSGPLSAAIIKPMGIEGLEFIIMPVRIS